MLNFFTRAARQILPTNPLVTSLQKRLQLLSSFTLQDVLYEIPADNRGILTSFAKHIAVESYKFDPLVPTTIRYADYFPVQDMRSFQHEAVKVATNQLPALIIFAFTYRSNGDPGKFANVLNLIDKLCVERLPEMNCETILRTLFALLFLIPSKVVQTDFYKMATVRLLNEFGGDLSKEKFVQICFYLGLSKKNPNLHPISDRFGEFLSQNLPTYVQHLSSMDMAIVSNAIYKTATIVSSQEFFLRIEQEILGSKLDDSTLVTFIKNLRLHRIKLDSLCKHLSNLCNENDLGKIQAAELVHIFTYFGENRWDESKVTDKMVAEFMSRIMSTKKFQNSVEKIRTKDVCMFVWCCSQLNCKLSKVELSFLENLVLNKISNKEFKYSPDELVDCCLSLWAMGIKNRDILQQAIALKEWSKPNPKLREHAKVDTKLKVLQSVAAIEFPTWLKTIDKDIFVEKSLAPAYLLKSRSDLVSFEKQLKDEEGVSSTLLVCPIKGFNIPSILVEYNEETPKVFVELLNDEQLLKFSREPVALMKMKMNLLTIKGYTVACLRPQDLDIGSYTCLKDVAFKAENGSRSISVNSI